MARGKYAARAANRLAEIDAGLVAELREKLAAVTAERNNAQAQVEQLTVKQNSLARAAAEKIAGDEVRRLQEALLLEQKGRVEDRRALGRKFFDIFRHYDFAMPTAALEELTTLFNLSEELGALLQQGRKDSTRSGRRATVKKLGMIKETERQGFTI